MRQDSAGDIYRHGLMELAQATREKAPRGALFVGLVIENGDITTIVSDTTTPPGSASEIERMLGHEMAIITAELVRLVRTRVDECQAKGLNVDMEQVVMRCHEFGAEFSRKRAAGEDVDRNDIFLHPDALGPRDDGTKR